MKIKSVPKEELETMQYDDLAYIILREKGKKMKTADIFKVVCSTLGMSDAEYEAKIADFFILLATEKRFMQLDKGYWDLKENHKVEIKEEEDDEQDVIEIVEETTEEETEEVIFDSKNSDDDEDDDGLKDLVVIDDDDEEN